MEIEKKYLLKRCPENLDQFPHFTFTQSYISRQPVIRLRKIEEKESVSYILTVKSGGLSVRQEFELPLGKDEYERLFQKVEGRVIEKIRYRIPLEGGLTAEVDQFFGELAGLWLVEVEFATVEEMVKFQAPDWFGEDVSESSRYHNSVLSMG